MVHTPYENSSLPLASACPWTGSSEIGVVVTQPLVDLLWIWRNDKLGRDALQVQGGSLPLLRSCVASLPPKKGKLEVEL